VSHLTGTGERDTHYIEQEAEQAKRDRRSNERERHTAGYVAYTPENCEIGERYRQACHNCDVLAVWINRVLGYQRNATQDKQHGIAAALQLAILALREQEVAAKLEEREAEGEFNKMIREAV
jgi:hypothetical protein